MEERNVKRMILKIFEDIASHEIKNMRQQELENRLLKIHEDLLDVIHPLIW